MLTGYFEVVGVYCFGTPESVSKELPKLRNLLFAIHKATSRKFSAYLEENTLEVDRLLLQICSKTKKITCKSLDITDQQATARPAEFKYQSFLSKWNKLETELTLRISANIPFKLSKAALKTKILHGLNPSLSSIAAALATVRGNIMSSDQLLVNVQQGKGSHSKSVATQTFNVDFFIENIADATDEVKETTGRVYIHGTSCCRACVNPKATVADAIQALKYDAIRSVVSRCDVLCDDLLSSDEPNTQEDEEKGCKQLSRWQAPQRVFTNIPGTHFDFCDYMFADEKVQDSLERVNEFLGIFPSSDSVECPEKFPDCEQIASIVSEISKPDQDSTQEESNTQPDRSFTNKIVGAVVAVITAMTAAGVTYLWGEQG